MEDVRQPDPKCCHPGEGVGPLHVETEQVSRGNEQIGMTGCTSGRLVGVAGVREPSCFREQAQPAPFHEDLYSWCRVADGRRREMAEPHGWISSVRARRCRASARSTPAISEA